MARKRYSDENALRVLREIDVHLNDGLDVVSSCRKAEISDKTYLLLAQEVWRYVAVAVFQDGCST